MAIIHQQLEILKLIINNLYMQLDYKGVSLVETLIYVAILSLIVAGLFSFSLTIAANRNKVYAAQEVQSNIRSIVTAINADMRSADAVIAPTAGNSQTSLVLDMGTNPDITYDVVDEVLYRTIGVGDPTAVNTSRVLVQGINFTNLAESGERDSIELFVTVTYISNDSTDFNYGRALQTTFNTKK